MAIKYAEKGGVGSNAETESKHSDGGEGGRPEQHAGAVSQVLSEVFEPEPAPGVAGFFFEQRGTAESAHGGVAGFSWAHAGGNVFGDLLIEMELDFVV